MRLLLAARLSRSGDGQTGIDTQDQDARAWAEAQGHQIVGVAADRITGSVSPFKRKELGPWLNNPALREQYDAIVVSKMDRYTRRRDWDVREWAAKHNKKLIITNPELIWPPAPGDTATPILWETLVNIAVAEWESTSRRYTRMQTHLRENGFLVGLPPYGFRIEKVDGSAHKTMVADPVEAGYIRQAAERYLSGESLRECCDWLDSEGAKPRLGTKWACKTLQRLFRNPSLIGRRVSEETGKTTLRHEPIVDLQTWNKLQAEMDRKASRKGVAPKDTAMLTGIAVCKMCGGPMYHIRPGRKRKDGSEYRKDYYRCHGTERNPSRCGNMVPMEDVESDVEKWINGPFGDFARFETIVIPGHGHEDEIADIDRDIRELDLDDPKYLDNWTVLRAERTRLKNLPTAPAEVRQKPTGMTIRQYWATLDTPGRRAYLLELGMTARVRKGEKTEITVMGGLLDLRPGTPDALMWKFQQR
jgi:site-specific DNA recombinase